jgi:hypothetical protein
MNLKEYIKEKRPLISTSSIKTYTSILKNLYKKIFNSDDINIENFNESEKVLKFLKDIEPRKRKTILSALVVITNNKDYNKQMIDDIKEYNKEESKQVRTERQKANWVDTDELDTLFEHLRKQSSAITRIKKLTPSMYQDVQNYIILCLLGGYYIPPRRLMDFVNFKIKDIDKDIDNFIYGNRLFFNSYKTAKTYGKQIIDIPKELKNILTKWIKINPTNYLLFDIDYNQLNNVKLNQRLNKIFGKNISVNQLRKYYLTKKYEGLKDIKDELKKDFSDMGSSILQESIYIKPI